MSSVKEGAKERACRETPRDEIQEYLAKIRKSVAESEVMAQQVELRLQETDRLLASHGLTREQLLSFMFTDEQRELVNRELQRRGLGRLDFADHEGFDDLADGATEGAVLQINGGEADSPRVKIKLREIAKPKFGIISVNNSTERNRV